MKALTLYQPYATLVAIAAKRIETRSWKTSYRGPLAIHAAKRWDSSIAIDCIRAQRILERRDWPVTPASEVLWRDTLGKVVAVATLVGCQRTFDWPYQDPDVTSLEDEFGDFSVGRWAWKLADIRPIVPGIPQLGSRGLWTVAEDLEALISERTRFSILEVTDSESQCHLSRVRTAGVTPELPGMGED